MTPPLASSRVPQTSNRILALALHLTGHALVASLNNGIYCYDLASGCMEVAWQLPLRQATRLAISPGGHLLAAACTGTNAIHVYRMMPALGAVATLRGHVSVITGTAWVQC